MRILLADDDPKFSYVLKKELEEKSYTVDVANNGVDAVLSFIKNEYGFVLLDLKMPRLNGIDALKIIGALQRAGMINPKAQVITLSGEVNDRSFKESLHAGAIKYIVKPFSVETLAHFIQRV